MVPSLGRNLVEFITVLIVYKLDLEISCLGVYFSCDYASIYAHGYSVKLLH